MKTLTRAGLAATGQPVKQIIDSRVALEAQRLSSRPERSATFSPLAGTYVRNDGAAVLKSGA